MSCTDAELILSVLFLSNISSNISNRTLTAVLVVAVVIVLALALATIV